MDHLDELENQSIFIMREAYDNKIPILIDNLLNDKIALDREKTKNNQKSKLFSIEKNLNETLELIGRIEQ